MERKNIVRVFSTVILLIFIISGCQREPEPEAAKTLDIGVASSITGVAAFLGNHMKNGILMAINDQNEKGGITIAGKKYMLNPIVRDTKSNPQVGKTVAEELITVHKVKIITGPFAIESTGIQPVTEPNKVLLFLIAPNMPGQCGPDNPHTFFNAGTFEFVICNKYEFLRKYHPDVKTVLGMSPDTLDLPPVQALEEKYAPEYGYTWLGVEKFPATTTDFMPVISRALEYKPDAINTMNTIGTMGPAGIVLVKQLREAGYKGIIYLRGAADEKMLLEIVGKENLYGFIESGIQKDSPLVPQPYREIMDRYEKEFNMGWLDVVGEYYNPTKALFEFLDGQDTWDTDEWAEEFSKYRWTGIFGESFWGCKPIYGINRVCVASAFVSEWIDGKRVTKMFDLPPSSLTGE